MEVCAKTVRKFEARFGLVEAGVDENKERQRLAEGDQTRVEEQARLLQEQLGVMESAVPLKDPEATDFQRPMGATALRASAKDRVEKSETVDAFDSWLSECDI